MVQRILIVDDEAPIRFAMRDYFLTHGAHVDCAGSLQEARVLLDQFRYSAVIADLCLTGSSGADGLHVLCRARELDPSTRTVLLTAYGSSDMRAAAQGLGISAFLEKPIPLSTIAMIALDAPGEQAPSDRGDTP